ncbi:MAG: ABC transporter permease [Bacteroidota bacterium]
MFQHILKSTFRNFLRHKNSFFINLIGLSTGLACALLIYLWVNDERSFDQFHENEVYQFMSNHPNDAGVETWRWSPAELGETIEEEMPEIEKTASASGMFPSSFVLSVDNQKIKTKGQFVDNQYFQLFSYPILDGNSKELLPAKNAIAISESVAMRLFNTTENLIGKTVDWNLDQFGNQAVISGVFKDLPSNSSQQFEVTFSFEFYKEMLGRSMHWGNYNAETYALLAGGTNVENFNTKIKNYIATKRENDEIELFLQAYADRYLNDKFEDGKQAGGRITYVRLFSLIAVFILLIACINFMNLSTARGTVRMKEVGVKKTLGADRKSLITQYLGEAILLTSLALVVAIALVFLLLPQFNQVTDKQLSLSFQPQLMLVLFGITFLTGIFAGSYPAFHLSGFKPTAIFKGKIHNSIVELWAREGLVVFQFVLSLVLIIAVTVVYQQVEYIQDKNLGYEKEQVLYFSLEGKGIKNPETLASEVKKLPHILNASSMWGSFVGRTASTGGQFNWEGRDPEKQIRFNHLSVNYDALELLDVKLSQGRSFASQFGEESSKIIINEAGIEAMGLKNPVGKTFDLWEKQYEIIGIAEDFHFESLHRSIGPFFIRYSQGNLDKVIVKIEKGKEQLAIAELQKFYKNYNPGFEFNYTFLDDDFQSLYAAESRVAVLSRFFAGIAILISCLGLFGLAAFTANRKKKEIGVRKVLGASVSNIILLITKDFTRLVLVAILIGVPIAYHLTSNWLNNFSYHINLNIGFFLVAAAIVVIIAWLTVGSQAIRAALLNPKEVINEE